MIGFGLEVVKGPNAPESWCHIPHPILTPTGAMNPFNGHLVLRGRLGLEAHLAVAGYRGQSLRCFEAVWVLGYLHVLQYGLQVLVPSAFVASVQCCRVTIVTECWPFFPGARSSLYRCLQEHHDHLHKHHNNNRDSHDAGQLCAAPFLFSFTPALNALLIRVPRM